VEHSVRRSLHRGNWIDVPGRIWPLLLLPRKNRPNRTCPILVGIGWNSSYAGPLGLIWFRKTTWQPIGVIFPVQVKT